MDQLLKRDAKRVEKPDHFWEMRRKKKRKRERDDRYHEEIEDNLSTEEATRMRKIKTRHKKLH